MDTPMIAEDMSSMAIRAIEKRITRQENEGIKWRDMPLSHRHAVGCNLAAKNADKSDPFSVSRIYSHLVHGVTTPETYL